MVEAKESDARIRGYQYSPEPSYTVSHGPGERGCGTISTSSRRRVGARCLRLPRAGFSVAEPAKAMKWEAKDGLKNTFGTGAERRVVAPRRREAEKEAEQLKLSGATFAAVWERRNLWLSHNHVSDAVGSTVITRTL
jgi:hypothetical protein